MRAAHRAPPEQQTTTAQQGLSGRQQVIPLIEALTQALATTKKNE